MEKKTPLYEKHVAAGAKMIPFGGWIMPVQYVGIIDEHLTVRRSAGLFDVSHMGEVLVEGEEAGPFLDYLLTNWITAIADGQAIYSPMCTPEGGVIDDLLVYRFGETKFLLVVNAGNKDKDVTWIQKQGANFNVTITDQSDMYGQLALQGPNAQKILQVLVKEDLQDLGYYRFLPSIQVDEVPCMVSRTGYTGEDGFELYCFADDLGILWEKLLTAGQAHGLKAIGLGARDTLRLEAGMPLYGHELSDTISPLEAGLAFAVKLDKETFIGKEVLAKQKAEGLSRKIVGLEMKERGVPRAGYEVFNDDLKVGVVTSGTAAPAIGKNIAYALLDKDKQALGSNVQVEIRGKRIEAIIIKTPFYKRGN